MLLQAAKDVINPYAPFNSLTLCLNSVLLNCLYSLNKSVKNVQRCGFFTADITEEQKQFNHSKE